MLNALWFVFFLRLTIDGFCYAKQDRDASPQRECKLEGLHPLLIITYRNITISADKITVPHGERVTARCRELGRYKLLGDPLLQCRNGAWNGKPPSCIPTTAISNYTENVPPTIMFGLPRGSAAIEPSGALAVFPGSILHLECLFARRLGNPEWTWTSTFRQYLTGWAIAASERDWKYRLSIYYAKIQDSGIYTCSTPRGLANSIRVHVVDVHCPTIGSPASPLVANIQGARMGQSAEFSCPTGYRLDGPRSITCQFNGKWSGEIPHCEAILCPPLEPANGRLLLMEHNNTVGGRAVFACMWGNVLLGPLSIRCEGDGVWNGSMPTCKGEFELRYDSDFNGSVTVTGDLRCVILGLYVCVDAERQREITCPVPVTPKYGRIVENEKASSNKRRGKPHKAGTLVRFSCQPGHQLIGEASIICTENSTWSHQSPLCEVRCPYPGDPPHGKIVPLKFWYKPGDNIQVECSPGYVTPLEPVRKPTCRENGIWSGPPPPCRSYRDV